MGTNRRKIIGRIKKGSAETIVRAPTQNHTEKQTLINHMLINKVINGRKVTENIELH